MDVVLDTNFLLDAVRFRIPLKEEFRRVLGRPTLIVLEPVLEELGHLKTNLAKTAKAQLDTLNYVFAPSKETADDAIFTYAKRHRCVIATHDRALKKKIEVLRTCKFLIIRGKKRLLLA